MSSTYKPLVARPHSEIDRDAARGTLGTAKARRGAELSTDQKRKLKRVHFLHCWELKRWEQVRKAVAYYEGGKRKGRWSPPPPRVDWQAVGLSSRHGIFMHPDRARSWTHEYGKKIRSLIRSGVHTDLPAFTVSRQCLGMLPQS